MMIKGVGGGAEYSIAYCELVGLAIKDKKNGVNEWWSLDGGQLHQKLVLFVIGQVRCR